MNNSTTFRYVCTTCDSQATKPPCARTVDPQRPLETSKATLGTWSCHRCGKGVKVRRETVLAKREAA